MLTEYKGMKVFANFDKTQCGLDISIEEGFFITTQMEKSYDGPVFIQGPVAPLSESKDADIQALYEEIKDEKYFIILKEHYG